MWFYGTRIKNLSPSCLLRMVRNSVLQRISLLKKECRETCRLHRETPRSMTHLAKPMENLNCSWQDQCTTRNTMQKELNIGKEDAEDPCMQNPLAQGNSGKHGGVFITLWRSFACVPACSGCFPGILAPWLAFKESIRITFTSWKPGCAF